jgi:hypothetical protein
MSGHVPLGDVYAYYEEDVDGEPLVLLHPGLADSRAFKEYLPTLAERSAYFAPTVAATVARPTSRARSPYVANIR